MAQNQHHNPQEAKSEKSRHAMRRIAKRKLKQQAGQQIPFKGCASGESSPADPKKESKQERTKGQAQNVPAKKLVKCDQNTNDKRRKKTEEPKPPRDPAQLPLVKYKTRLCRHFVASNSCALGDTCSFAHGQSEIRKQDEPVPQTFPGLDHVGAVHSNYKTQPCRNFELNGMCSYGNLCCFAHGPSDLRRLTQPMPAIPPEVLIYGPPNMVL